MPAIETNNLAKHFGDVAAVDGVSLRVEDGEVFALVGPDGAGKTTMMRLLASIMLPTGGDASVAGFDVVHQAELVKEHIGYMSQRFGLYADLTVLENIHFYADIFGVARRERAARIERLLGFSGLIPFGGRLAGNLSGGMKQKLALACTLIHTPKVLLLDEPTNGVDPVSRRDFWRILYQMLREGVTIFVSTSYLDEAERCSRLALMNEGRLLAVGTPREVKALMTQTILEVRVGSPRAAAAVLTAAMPGRRVSMFGDRVHVATSAADDAAKIRAALDKAGTPATSVGPIEPSLEDVFVSVVTEKKNAQ